MKKIILMLLILGSFQLNAMERDEQLEVVVHSSTCAQCNQSCLLQCPKCSGEHYCDKKECQLQHWQKTHSGDVAIITGAFKGDYTVMKTLFEWYAKKAQDVHSSHLADEAMRWETRLLLRVSQDARCTNNCDVVRNAALKEFAEGAGLIIGDFVANKLFDENKLKNKETVAEAAGWIKAVMDSNQLVGPEKIKNYGESILIPADQWDRARREMLVEWLGWIDKVI